MPIGNSKPVDIEAVCRDLKRQYPNLLGCVNQTRPVSPPHTTDFQDVCASIVSRARAINVQICKSVEHAREDIECAVRLFRDWMLDRTIVRIVGAGRARLAASIPANRLAHGGARVFVQDDIVPMPHSIKGGGVIAASASGRTETVLSVLRTVYPIKSVQIVGLADASATDFRNHCHVFIGIQPAPVGINNPLRALADSEEYVISEILDAMVVAAGKLAGFDDSFWRLGHEDLGGTGPYNLGQDNGCR